MSKLSFDRIFTADIEPNKVFESCEWELRTGETKDMNGDVIFEQKDCRIPTHWSQQATNIVVSKYFRGPLGTPSRETSVEQIIERVAFAIADYGYNHDYFKNSLQATNFRDELIYLLLYQHASFNSPVWFNIGVKGSRQQASACFINRVEDSISSITDLMAHEALLFKYGSGSGTNLSRIRSTREKLSLGGEASGPLSFMKALDSVAGSMKSGGTTRRAALMRCMDVTHPDILDFIECKLIEEKKAHALIDAGYDGSFNMPGGAYDSVTFQNANNSVRVTDAFMNAAENGCTYNTRTVTDDKIADTLDARQVLMRMAEATHICGDPGIQYDSKINEWHTCPNTDRIYASNPCSEYMFLDDSACNLASLNLMKYRKEDGTFDVDRFTAACRVMITAQEILVSYAEYPTEAIAKNSEDYRPLGLGYANLGALLMSRGLAYDSDEGRNLAAAITAIMCGAAYLQSAEMAEAVGAFSGYDSNREPMLRVIGKHWDSVHSYISGEEGEEEEELLSSAYALWKAAFMKGEMWGFRNAQVTVLAPTGTIAFMMDCDTTGIEPAISLVAYKKMVGGGNMKIVNQTVPEALRKLGYHESKVEDIVKYIDTHDTIEGNEWMSEDEYEVFDCAFKAMNGTRSIHYMGHIKMMAACQPFLSGAISKTVNLPEDCTVEDVYNAYVESWKLGLKAVAVYRDGSKRTQPLSTSSGQVQTLGEGELVELPHSITSAPLRLKLNDTRDSTTHKFSIADQKGYMIVGMYPDGSPGEMFVKMNKEGSTLSGLMDAFATAISIGLQYGVPLQVFVNKFKYSRFEPHGFTSNPEIRQASSIVDYLFKWMEARFLQSTPRALESLDNGMIWRESTPFDSHILSPEKTAPSNQFGPPCKNCGGIMVRAGACYSCPNCGETSGCG